MGLPNMLVGTSAGQVAPGVQAAGSAACVLGQPVTACLYTWKCVSYGTRPSVRHVRLRNSAAS